MTPAPLTVQLITGTVAAATVAVMPALTAAPDLSETALLEYEDGFIGVAVDVGRVIEVGLPGADGMKPSIGAIDRGELPDTLLEQYTARWERALADSAERLEQLEVPPRLAPAHAGFSNAIDEYRSLVSTLASIASTSDADERDALLEVAIRLGSRGDLRFDHAAAVLQHHRRGAGLGPNLLLPDPETELPPGVRIVQPPDLREDRE